MNIKLLFSTFLTLLAAEVFAQHPAIGGYNVYYGSLHNHSTVSGATGTPATAYDYAKNTGKLDFFGLADHSNQISSEEWSDVINQANTFTQDGIFVGFYGFEWSSGGNYGHVAVVNTDDYCSTTSPTNTFAGLVTWLASRPNGIAFCNHPGREDDKGLEFSHFTTTPSNQIVGMELWNKNVGFNTYYFNDGYYPNDNNKGHYDEANNRGWRIGASGSGDNHGGTWGTSEPYRMAILANSLTRAELLAAIQARRFFSTLDKNLSLSFKINGMEMGSTITGGNYTAQIQAADADGEIFNQVILYDKNHNVVNTWSLSTNTVDVSINLNTVDGDYYYVKVRQADGNEAISSPIWISGSTVTDVAGENLLFTDSFKMKTYPNPYTDCISFELEFNKYAKVSLDIFNLNGIKIANVFSGGVGEGFHRFEYVPEQTINGFLIYRLNIEGRKTVSGKVIQR